MKLHPFHIIAMLAAAIFAMFSIDTADVCTSSRSYRTYGYGQEYGTRTETGDGPLTVMQDVDTESVRVSPQDVETVTENHCPFQIPNSELSTPPVALSSSAMTELTPVQLPPLDAGMVNVTGGFDENMQTAGYRVKPMPGEFAIAVPYDPALLPQGFTEDDIQTFVYDRQYQRWVVIQRDSVNEAELLVCSRFRPWERGLPHTQNDMSNPQDVLAQAQDMMSMASQGEGVGESPLDFINAVLKTPEMPETSAYTPTSIKELKAADPLEGLTLMQPPTANNMGTANLSYPIEIPAGRQGMQPNLALTYSSGGGNGWLGVGWDISIPSITVETRWGVPRYDQSKESEVYVYEGEQLVTMDGSGHFREMPHRTNRWTDRHDLDQDGHEQFFPRKNEAYDSIVRHGSGPGGYWWTVTHKNGVTDYYGKYASDNGVNKKCVLDDPATGNIARWMLAESRDAYGNSVRYHYVKVMCGSVNTTGSANRGVQIYPDHIDYTGHGTDNGTYSVRFNRKDGRTDVITSGRYGFREVTASTLCNVEVLCLGSMIRRYFFVTENRRGSGFRTRLTDLVRQDPPYEHDIDCDSVLNPTYWRDGHEFDCSYAFAKLNLTRINFAYFDYPVKNSLFGAPETITFTGDMVESSFEGGGSATALGATSSKGWSAGGTVCVGLGATVWCSDNSVGGNFSYSRSRSKGLLTLIDLDGDGMADKVYKVDGKVYYRRCIPNGEYSFGYGPETLLAGVADFLDVVGNTPSFGVQGHFGEFNVNAGLPVSVSDTRVYFSDVNGDGLPDIVTDKGVLFNNTGDDGDVSFVPWQTLARPNPADQSENTLVVTSSSGGCGGIIYDGEVNGDILCKVYRFDTLYVPESKLFDAIDSLQQLGYEVTDYTDTGVTYCKSDTAVTYCTTDTGEPDLDAVRVWVAPHDGTVHVSSTVTVIEDNSESAMQSRRRDGMVFSIQHEWGVRTDRYALVSDSATVLSRDTVAAGDMLVTDTIFPVRQNDILFFRLQSGANRTADRVQDWETIAYTSGDDNTIYDSDHDFVLTGKGLFQAPKRGSVTITGTLRRKVNSQLDTYKLVVKRNNVIEYSDSMTSSMSSLQVNRSFQVDSADTVRIGILPETGGTDWGNLSFIPVLRFDGNPADTNLVMTGPVSLYPHVFMDIIHGNTDHLRDSLTYWFGKLYKGWGYFTYNNNFPGSAGLPIDVSRLIIPAAVTGDSTGISRSSLSSTINEARYSVDTTNTDTPTANFTPESLASNIDSLYNPLSDSTSWVPMFPDGESGAYMGFGGITEVASWMMGNTRHIIELQQDIDENENDYDSLGNFVSEIPVYDDVVPVSTDGLPVRTIRKRSVGVTGSVGAGLSIGPNLSLSLSLGSNTVQSDFLDLNGDRYPDIFAKKTVQYTMPWGGLEDATHCTGSDDRHVSQSLTYAFGLTIGGGYPDPYREEGTKPPDDRMSFRGASFSGSHVRGSDNTNLLFLDVNGDGLPDKVWLDDKKTALNTGYGFQSPEAWEIPDVRKGASSSTSLSGGANFSYNQYSLGGGVGFSVSESRSKSLLLDINGDGLPDYAELDNAGLNIRYGLGNGKWSLTPDIIHNIHNIGGSVTKSMSSSIDVTVGFPVMAVKLTVGVQASPLDKSFTRDECQIADVNGDGYPDLVTSQSESSMTVRYSTAGKTNLLRQVTNFTGSVMEIDYNMPQSSYEKPQREWTLNEVTVYDTIFQQHGNRSHTRYTYEDPHYDRYERLDYGYSKVKSYQYDTDGGDTIYRCTIEEYNNRDFAKRGRKTRDCVCDASGNPYVEHIYGDTLYDFAGSMVSDSVCARSDIYVKKEVDITNWYEGGQSPQVTSMVEREYDRRRNVVRYTHYGDTTHTDERFSAEIGYATGMPRNLVSLPVRMMVRNAAGDLLQWRTAGYYPTGKLEYLTEYSSPSDSSRYDFTYDTCGNLSSAALPSHRNGRRLEYSYTYDSLTRTYPSVVRNLSFGLTSMAEYDCRFGKPTRTVDANGNEMRYGYDDMGRLIMVKAPYELESLPGDMFGTVNYRYYPHNYGVLDIFNAGPCAQMLSAAFTECIDTEQQNLSPIRTIALCDNLGRPVQTKRSAEVDGDTSLVVTGRTVYDCFGRVVERHVPFTVPVSYIDTMRQYSDSATMREFAAKYDILDRQTREILPCGHVTNTTYGFGITGNKTLLRTTVTDAQGNVVTTLRGTMGQVLRQDAPLNTVTTFTYDALGRLLTSTDPMNLTTVYTYDMFGRLISRTHPDAGTDIYGYELSGGNLEWHVNGHGDTIRYQYDYNRLTGIQYPLHPENNVHYTYGTLADTATNAAGRVILREDGSGWQAFKYGKLGEVTEETRTFALPYETAPRTFKTRFNYDSFNRIRSITYPDGETVRYRYNCGGDLCAMTGTYVKLNDHAGPSPNLPKEGLDGYGRTTPGGGIVTDTTYTFRYIDSIRYDKYGSRTMIWYGNGTNAEYGYDSLRRLSTLRARTSSGALMQKITYTYDTVGNIKAISNAALPVNGMGGQYNAQYIYDNLYRLSSATGTWHPRGIRLPFSVSMRYMSNGRIFIKEAEYSTYTGGTVANRRYENTYAYPAGRNTVTAVEDLLGGDRYDFTWDVCGNMTRWSFRGGNGIRIVRSLDWTEENSLRKVTDMDNFSYYMYDADEERTCKLVWQGNVQIINGRNMVHYTPEGITLYASPYLVITPQGYTKHYYAGDERVASQVGKGFFAGLNISLAGTAATASKLSVAEQSVDLDPRVCSAPTTPLLAYLDNLTDRTDSFPESYFYHPDHLGSASWVTDSAGRPVQHLQYLPWGEDFVDQRTTNWHARFTFSAKEKDAETGYSYFGSRYYSSDLSIWLSVDPMSDKYSSLSPYVYCADNPVKLVDPNGEEIYEFDENGKYLGMSGEKGSPDQIAIKNSDGTIKMSQEYEHGTIQLGLKGTVNQHDGTPVDIQSLRIKGDDNAYDCFEFVSDNSSVEWSMVRTGSVQGDKGINYLSSSQENSHENSLNLYTSNIKISIREHWHSHTNGSLKPSEIDYTASDKLREQYGNVFSPTGYVPTYVYARGKHRLYNSFLRMIDNNIINAINEYQKK